MRLFLYATLFSILLAFVSVVPLAYCEETPQVTNVEVAQDTVVEKSSLKKLQRHCSLFYFLTLVSAPFKFQK